MAEAGHHAHAIRRATLDHSGNLPGGRRSSFAQTEQPRVIIHPIKSQLLASQTEIGVVRPRQRLSQIQREAPVDLHVRGSFQNAFAQSRQRHKDLDRRARRVAFAERHLLIHHR